MELIEYSNQWKQILYNFFIEQYPNRSKEFVLWWIDQIEKTKAEKRTYLVIENNKILGCTQGIYFNVIDKNKNKTLLYWSANTVVDKKERGRGIGKLLSDKWQYNDDFAAVGFSEAMWKITVKQFKGLYRTMSFVNVFVDINIKVVCSAFQYILNKLFKKSTIKKELIIPKSKLFTLINNSEELFLTDNYIGCDAQVLRDNNFIKERFFNIYLNNHIFKYDVNGVTECYFVVRLIQLYGITMLSLVDYRYTDEKYVTLIRKELRKIAKKNNIGLCMILTSEKKWFGYKLKKELQAITFNKDVNTDILITSADSDLDFVYYK